MIASVLLRFWPHIAGAVLLIGGLWYIHHHGYNAGQDERTAYYQPILTAVEGERRAAEARIATLRKAQKALNTEVEQRHARNLQAIQNRATRAEQRIVSLLQVGAGRCREPVPAAAGASPEPESTAEELERFGRVGAGIAAVGRRCEEDAGQLAELQRWYATQRDFLNP